jgi:aminocarboxymuconate-semialdehyde decarboxylase
MQKAIDVHSHMLCREWFEIFRAHSGPRFTIRQVAAGAEVVHFDGVPFMTPQKEMFDYAERFKGMDEAGVAMAVLSLTGPNVQWGDDEASTRAAVAINDSFAEAQALYPDRIRWMASLPFRYTKSALNELARAMDNGASGVMTLANIAEHSLTDPLFAPVWKEIDRRELAVFIHPTVPCGCAVMDMAVYQLSASIGFTMDTTLAFSRMIFDGFFDRYPNIKMISAHGGGTLPFLAARLDRCYDMIPACREKIGERPSAYIRRFYADSILYSSEAMKMTVNAFGDDHVLYGTDYPHNISDMKGILALIDELPAGQRDNVRGANAQRLFRIEG